MSWKDDKTFGEVICRLVPLLDKYKDTKNLELEFRLGSLGEDGFSSSVCEEFYNKILGILGKSNVWKDKENESTTDYFDKGMRLSVFDDKNKKKKCIIKNKLVTIDCEFQDCPFDIRICLSEEIPVAVSKFKMKKSLYSRSKERSTFVYKNWKFDLTKTNVVDNTVEDTFHEIELEYSSFGTASSSGYVLHSGFFKVRDLINMCEKLDDTNVLEIVDIKEYA